MHFEGNPRISKTCVNGGRVASIEKQVQLNDITLQLTEHLTYTYYFPVV